ncbi:hypothetical protein [Chryseobacterium sp.]|uniref:hypothetical protein n=1 Tax=Chryseobacterium sp. TaxID=1871047 RepID=UPI0012AA7D04|nr:hypothetical protein [Chryseobacterium sp.]QFG54301.1 hypothetical protein F7R58_12365 [Chryseobacterium sp.]
MKTIFCKTILALSIFVSIFSEAQQTVTVWGIAKDSINNFISIVVNDTLQKFREKASRDEGFAKKYQSEFDALVNNKDFHTIPDSGGNYTINAKLTDTLYFRRFKFATQKYKVGDIIAKKTEVFLKPAPCKKLKQCEHKQPDKLYIFVGKKLNVSHIDTSTYCENIWDSAYRAEYKIIQQYSDYYPDSNIVFTAYDHNSTYEYQFQNYETVLIFVGEFCNELIHLKYQFFPVYKTKNGRWASPVKPHDELYYKDWKCNTIEPEKINFDKSVYFEIQRQKGLTDQQQKGYSEQQFPKKYYEVKKEKAVPIMGRYAEDLIRLWKECRTTKAD